MYGQTLADDKCEVTNDGPDPLAKRHAEAAADPVRLTRSSARDHR
jgi:hypothetical protein